MVHLEKVNGENIWDILKLSVSESQKNFVASNEVSILEAYAAIASNGYAFPFGVFDGNAPVGFVMVGYGKDDCWKDAPAIAEGNYNLWRLMIDESCQNRGYGRQAVELALRQHRTIAEASAVESPIRQETIGFPAHFFARAHNFKPPGRACQPEADSPMRT